MFKSHSLLLDVKGYVDGKRFVPVAIERENKIHRNMDNRHEQCHREDSCVAIVIYKIARHIGKRYLEISIGFINLDLSL